MNTPADTAATLQPHPGCTLQQYAEAKRLPIEFLMELGLADQAMGGRPAVRIPYRNESGEELAVRFRHELSAGDGTRPRFTWRRGCKAGLYGLWRMSEARAADQVVLVEGESDAQTLWHHGIPALGIPGANTWRDEWAARFDSISKIYVVVEPDAGGQATLQWVARSTAREKIHLVRLDGFKDPSAMHLDAPERFRERWDAAVAAAEPWSAHARLTREMERNAAWSACGELATVPDLLDLFVSDLRAMGVVGEARAAKLLYLCVTSRLLERPVSVVMKGPSGAGKSYLTESVLKFFPPEAYYTLTAMSERALVYSTEPLEHRVLVLFEAAGVQGEVGTYLLRSLISEGRLRYETVEKTSNGMKPLLIDRPGPTGVILTTTATRLHPENETRLMSIPVTDTPDHTRAVFLSLAAPVRADVSVARWHALQSWLARGEVGVVIPYAETLANLVPPTAVRMRRDFGQLLQLIRAHALLHRATRDHDCEGRTVARLDDYEAVRQLTHDLVAEGVDVAVPETVRETVAAVDRLTQGRPVTISAVARELGLDRSAAHRRVRQAIDRGYLINEESGRGRPAMLVLGDSLPEQATVLPEVSQLEGLEGCRVADEREGMDQRSPGGDGCRVAWFPGGVLSAPDPAGVDDVAPAADQFEVVTNGQATSSARPDLPFGDAPAGFQRNGDIPEVPAATVEEQEPSPTVRDPLEPKTCHLCGGRRFWRARVGRGYLCGACHPAPHPELVAEWLDAEQACDD